MLEVWEDGQRNGRRKNAMHTGEREMEKSKQYSNVRSIEQAPFVF